MDEMHSLILTKLGELEKQVSHMREDITRVRVDIATLKAKSMMYGGAVGAVMSGLVVTFFSLFIKK